MSDVSFYISNTFFCFPYFQYIHIRKSLNIDKITVREVWTGTIMTMIISKRLIGNILSLGVFHANKISICLDPHLN